METLAYLHLACENESPDDTHPDRESTPLKLNWKKFSSVACIQVLSLGVAIAGFTSSAMAQSGVLQQGDQGAAVTELQDRLRAAGCFEGSSTGFFGEQTRAAVIRCQERFGLTPDGIAGEATLSALASGSDIPTNGTPSTVGFGTPSFGETLQFGDEGAGVSQLQQRLQELGYYYGEIDGVFGSETQRAVLQFQRDRGLTEDGVVGPQVYAALQGNGTPRPPIEELPPSTGGELTLGDTGARVTALQQRLNSAGYPVVVDGVYGENTRSAVIAFQRDRGLPATGTADSQTLAALGVPDVGGIPQRNRYVVIIPTPDRAALAKVQTVLPTAVARTDRRGNYVQAGAFATPEEADRRAQLLRSRGLDARVIFQ